jgi:23S rRNA (cytidine1920-2'-O)/16S rRNA (cytidine1409-2'-O)-methyltransferase
VPRHHRLDAELVRRGLVASRTEAKVAIESGIVTVNGVRADRPATMVGPDTPVVMTGPARRFVSRGGEKLDGALDRLDIDVAGRTWLDAGASTGGFTDCLLQRGATRVLAVDVGYGQFDWGLRNDERVSLLERTNIRTLNATDLPWLPQGAVADLSFISLTSVIAALAHVTTQDADLVLMVKPQFEVGRENLGKGGVVKDPGLWTQALRAVVDAGTAVGLGLQGATLAHPPGPAGNREFFIWLKKAPASSFDHIGTAVGEAVGR